MKNKYFLLIPISHLSCYSYIWSIHFYVSDRKRTEGHTEMFLKTPIFVRHKQQTTRDEEERRPRLLSKRKIQQNRLD
jgi:hypothetical protein